MAQDLEEMRKDMVDTQIAARGITDKRVLAAFGKVPRHKFVPEDFQDAAYSDHPLPIGNGQTISQPYMVALMTEKLALKDGERVLEIGTGSGYQLAILAELAKEVYSIERFENLAEAARAKMEALGYRNVVIRSGDGTLGWEEYAPYDGIVVTAAAPDIPQSLVRQLKQGGKLVIPVGGAFGQILMVVTKEEGSIKTEEICGCVFVPLIGKEGWSGK